MTTLHRCGGDLSRVWWRKLGTWFRSGLAVVACALGVTETLAAWRAGAASIVITPPQPMPMAGYASRGAQHAQGLLNDLYAKALVLEDDAGERGLLVTLDLVGIERHLSLSICQRLQQAFGFERRQIVLAASHTHSGPVVAKNLRPMHYEVLSEADRELVDRYARFLEERIEAVVREALAALGPAELSWGSGRADFAVNRRNNREADVPRLREAGQLQGPVDHDVPVLAVHREGRLVAVVFGYACHCTVLSGFDWSGDYAGFAQQILEAAHPGTVALFWAGCGGDQNPIPRREVALARAYGEQLARSVEAVLAAPLRPVNGGLSCRYTEIPLRFGELPTREALVTASSSNNKYEAARARFLLAQLDAGQSLPTTYPYPVTLWRLGSEVRWFFLGGEVVVDYALRIKAELGTAERGRTDVWVAAYSQDVMAYIPSRRVLLEGGYEGGGAMIYYGHPTVWSSEVEEQILQAVHAAAP